MNVAIKERLLLIWIVAMGLSNPASSLASITMGNFHSRGPRALSNFRLTSTSEDSTGVDNQEGLRGTTAQERILKEIFDIEPETEFQKEERLKQRIQLLNKSKNEKMKNVIVAVLAFSAAFLNYAWQYTHPITSLSLLAEMQSNSAELNVIGNNGKPTVVDFWAPWCENCKSFAPTSAIVEKEYEGRVNFVMVDGDKGENWPIIERFGVDAIPHLAMVGSDGFVETALIGPIPRAVLRQDLDVMLLNAEKSSEGNVVKKVLPYTMFDAFRSNPENRQLHFSVDAPPIELGRQQDK